MQRNMRYLTLILFIFLLGLTSKTYPQRFKNAIIEIYVDNDTVEKFDYNLKIISKGDTLTPLIKNKYFLPSLKLDKFVTLIISYKESKVTIPYVENIFLSGCSYLKARISTVAKDTCVKLIFDCGDTRYHIEPECEKFHDILFVHFTIYTSDTFIKKWKNKKKQ